MSFENHIKILQKIAQESDNCGNRAKKKIKR